MSPQDEIMLDEYGNPIGQLTVKMGREALHVPDDAVTVAQENALEDNAAELPGIEAKEIAEFYPSYDDDRRREHAKRLMIIEGRTVEDIADIVKVPERTVLMWAANFKWADARRREIIAKDELSRLELADTRVRKRNEVFNEQLAQAKKIRDEAAASMVTKHGISKSASDAWNAAAKTEQTILGLSEAGSVAAADGTDGKKDGPAGKTPLVAVVVGGGLPPIRRPGA